MADQTETLQSPVADADAARSNVTGTSTSTSGAGAGGGGGILQGTLLYRRNLSAKKMWKSSMRMYTVLDMTQPPPPSPSPPPSSGTTASDMWGSFTCYRFEGLSKREANLAYAPTELKGGSVQYQGMSNVRTCLELPSHLPWTVRDVENDASAFMAEIPVEEGLACLRQHQRDEAAVGGGEYSPADGGDQFGDDDAVAAAAADSYDDDDYDYAEDEDDDGMYVFWGDGDVDEDAEGDDNEVANSTRTESTSGSEHMEVVPNQAEVDLLRAAARRRPYVRYAFRCPTKRNEKALWLTAFQKVGRLATESRRKRSLFGSAALSVPAIRQGNSRLRTGRGVDLARQSMKLDKDAVGENEAEDGPASPAPLSADPSTGTVKEYRVRPNYAYPHRWMTHEELMDEMLCPSAEVHDLRLPPALAPDREIGLLQVEVLQCLGLPRPKGKTASINPNPVVYLVCGSYAFATDIIPQCTDPMWLKAMRRKCQIPINHGYARLFVGVFHDDGSKSPKDLFIGRAIVELSRLRPGGTYDVTLPLRQSASVYSRRKRGAVRLRFNLDVSDQKQLVLSYFPSKRNQLAGQAGTTTVACADPKAFRNVALTVNGVHLPGKFSTDHFMALIREFKLVQKVIRQLLVKFVEDLVVWRYPVKSAFVFIAWMHSLYANSATMIPVYVVSFIFLQLMENYARCIIGGAEFRPATWEEMFASLTGAGGGIPGGGGKSGKIHPLDGIVDKYDPIGQSIFTMLGFVGKKDEYFVGGVDTYALDEFPYASLAGYPRFSVDESVVKAPANPTALEMQAGGAGADTGEDEDDEGGGDLMGDPQSSSDRINANAEEYQPRIYFKKRIPQQNIDLKVKGDGKTIADELQEIEEKIQKATKYTFRDNAYLVTDPSQPPFGKRTRDNDDYNIERDLNKLLGIGQFSQWNPIVAKVSVQFEPIIRICVVFLSLYRSIYNIFTWRDPYLSFWFSVVCLVTTIVMVLFPWRPCLFVVGLVALGPQNWLVRLFRELVWSSDESNRPGRFLRAFRELLRSSDDDDDDNDEGGKAAKGNRRALEGEPQPVFFAHAPASKPLLERTGAIGTQHVVVPYSPLNAQRFYDWPPDPKYARVTEGTSEDVSTLRMSSEKDITKAQIMPPASSPQTLRRQEAKEKSDSMRVEKKNESSPPTPPPSTPKLSSASSIKSSTRSVGGRIVLSLQGSRSKDEDEEPSSDRIGADSSPSRGSDALSAAAPSMATTNTATASSSKATSTLTAHASRSVGGLSKSLAKKGQGLTSSLKKSVNFNDDVSMLSTKSNSSAGKGKMSKLMKSAKLPGNIMKSKKGPRIGGEICVPEEISDDDWLKMPKPEESANSGADALQDEDEAERDTATQIESVFESTNAKSNEVSGVAGENTSLENVKEAPHETNARTALIPQPADSIDVEDEGAAVESSQADQGAEESSGAVEFRGANEEMDDTADGTNKDKVPMEDAGENETNGDEEKCDSDDFASDSAGDDAGPFEPIATLNEDESREKDTIPHRSIISGTDVSSSPLNGVVLSPVNDAATLLETLMEVKLELATVRTENDHYRARLKETEGERDHYKKKYNECIEERDARTPDWLANGKDEGSPPPLPPGQQQSSGQQQPPFGGFKMNMSSMSSPFRKQPPFK